MSKVVLHIGTHKTATTLIQGALANNRTILAQNNIIYPKIGEYSGHHILASEWINMGKDYELPIGGTGKIRQYLKENGTGGSKTVVLSSEEFSRAAPHRSNMAQLREHLSAFDTVEVVCFLRDQKSYLQSIYLEVSKHRVPKPPKQMHAEALRTYQADGLFLDYTKLYDHLLTGFSKDEITFIPFNETIGHEGGILGLFLKLLGFAPSHEFLLLDKTFSNKSEDALTMWLANTISAPQNASQELLQFVHNVLVAEFGGPLKTSLFRPQEINALKDVFDPINESLRMRIVDKQPYFKLAPIVDDETLPSPKDISKQLWGKLKR